MEIRKLGTQGLEVSVLGLGCMGMSEFYSGSNEQEAIDAVASALCERHNSPRSRNRGDAAGYC